jgi:hypothetical protein
MYTGALRNVPSHQCGNVPGGGSWCSRGVYVGVVVACGLLLVCAVRLGFLFRVFLWFLLSLCFFPSRACLRLFVTHQATNQISKSITPSHQSDIKVNKRICPDSQLSVLAWALNCSSFCIQCHSETEAKHQPAIIIASANEHFSRTIVSTQCSMLAHPTNLQTCLHSKVNDVSQPQPATCMLQRWW